MTRRAGALAIAIACALAVPSLPAPAFAQSAADMETARDLFKKGKALRDKGDLAGALEKLKAAHALGNTPITGLELGRTHMMRGELVEARDLFLAVGRIEQKKGESKNALDARVEAQKLADELKPRIPSLSIVINGAPAGSTVVVTIDEVTIPQAALGSPRKLNPGKHVVVARIEGSAEKKAEVDLKEKDEQSVTLDFTGTAKPVDKPIDKPVDKPIEKPKDRPESRGTSPLVYAGLAIVGVGAVVGTATGIVSLNKASTAKKQCVDGNCPPAVHDEVNAGKAFGTVSTVAFIFSGAGAVIAIVGLVVGGPAKTETAQGTIQVGSVNMTPSVGLGTFSVVGSF